MSVLAKAIAFAAEAHILQKDKRGEPYILHPMRIVLALRAAGYSETHQAVAALHDTVEDTATIFEDIYSNFGEMISDAVIAMTRREGEEYKEFIVRCCNNFIARTVKRFDVYDNADPHRFTPSAPIKRYLWVLEYLDELDQIDRARAEHGAKARVVKVNDPGDPNYYVVEPTLCNRRAYCILTEGHQGHCRE